MHALIGLGPRLGALAPPTPGGPGSLRPDVMELDTDAVLVRFSSPSATPGAGDAPAGLPPPVVADLEALLVDLGLGEDATCLVRIAGLGRSPRTHRVPVPGRLDRALMTGAPRSRS